MERRFCNLFSESSTVVQQLSCCPGKQGELKYDVTPSSGYILAQFLNQLCLFTISASQSNQTIRPDGPYYTVESHQHLMKSLTEHFVLAVGPLVVVVAVAPVAVQPFDRVARWQNLTPSFPWIVPGKEPTRAPSKERKGSNYAAQRSRAIFLRAHRQIGCRTVLCLV